MPRDIFEAADILTSNLVFSRVMHLLCQKINPANALLLVPGENPEDLTVVEVQGCLPEALSMTGIRNACESIPGVSGSIPNHLSWLRPYPNLLKLQTSQGETTGYLAFDGELPPENLFRDIAHHSARLLAIKKSLDRLPYLNAIESKLKYQMSFFANAVNNIFEPFGQEMLVQLYMEIISEMFLFPSALAMRLENGHYIPAFAKGESLSRFAGLALDARPIQRNPSLCRFPTVISDSGPDQIGEENYRRLIENRVSLLIPLNVDGEPLFIICCLTSAALSFDYQDKLCLTALNNTLNRALELSETRHRLTRANLELDRKVFSLTTIYHAAEEILSRSGIEETLDMALDILMEVFQSAHSAVIVHNFYDNRYELLNFKSSLAREELSYWFEAPPETIECSQPVMDYKNDPDVRSFFSHFFPGFSTIKERLQPEVVVHLIGSERYYGFITLSERMTGQGYLPEDFELLQLLANSIGVALDNAWMYNELQTANGELVQRIQDLYAIQDVLRIIRQACDLEDFCSLLGTALDMGVGVADAAILTRDNTILEVMEGNWNFTAEMIGKLSALTSPGMLKEEEGSPLLAIPLAHGKNLVGCLLVRRFRDTVLEDSNRIRLLEIIAGIIGDTFSNLLEARVSNRNGIPDYPSLVCHQVRKEVETLKYYGFKPIIVKFQHPRPFEVLDSLRDIGQGFILTPSTAILVSRLPETQLKSVLGAHTRRLRFIRRLTVNNLYRLTV